MSDSDYEGLLDDVEKRLKRQELCTEIGHRLSVSFVKFNEAANRVKNEFKSSESAHVHFLIGLCLAPAGGAVIGNLGAALGVALPAAREKYLNAKMQNYINGHVAKVMFKYSDSSLPYFNNHMERITQLLSEQYQAMREDIQDEGLVSMDELVVLKEMFDARFTTVEYFTKTLRETFREFSSLLDKNHIPWMLFYPVSIGTIATPDGKTMIAVMRHFEYNLPTLACQSINAPVFLFNYARATFESGDFSITTRQKKRNRKIVMTLVDDPKMISFVRASSVWKDGILGTDEYCVWDKCEWRPTQGVLTVCKSDVFYMNKLFL
jgi:hypothetical protein